jgi:hypothetical protein
MRSLTMKMSRKEGPAAGGMMSLRRAAGGAGGR